MRALLVVAAAVSSGCTAMAPAPQRGEVESRALSIASAAPARSTWRGGTQTVGLPLSRGGKIGLWAGVAIVLGYLMATDGEDDAADSVDP